MATKKPAKNKKPAAKKPVVKKTAVKKTPTRKKSPTTTNNYVAIDNGSNHLFGLFAPEEVVCAKEFSAVKEAADNLPITGTLLPWEEMSDTAYAIWYGRMTRVLLAAQLGISKMEQARKRTQQRRREGYKDAGNERKTNGDFIHQFTMKMKIPVGTKNEMTNSFPRGKVAAGSVAPATLKKTPTKKPAVKKGKGRKK